MVQVARKQEMVLNLNSNDRESMGTSCPLLAISGSESNRGDMAVIGAWTDASLLPAVTILS